MTLISREGIVLDPSVMLPAAEVVPAPPPAAMVVAAGALDADLTGDGALVIGDVTTGGAGALRTVTANSGDIFVAGVLRGGAMQAGRQSLVLNAPNGSVYITGVVDTSGDGNLGIVGGGVTIAARRVVITGKIVTRGDGALGAAGGAGAVTISATELVSVTGEIDASGGNAAGADRATGGKGGDLTINGDDLRLVGKIKLRGGAGNGAGADAQGGAAGVLRAEVNLAVHIGGIIDARGGGATAARTGGMVVAGEAGALRVGEMILPSTLNVAVPLLLTGGAGPAAGGKGGTLAIEARGGDLRLAGRIDVRGGSSGTVAGAAGTVNGQSGPLAGGIIISGQIVGSGGASEAGSGGAGALVTLFARATTGEFTVAPSAEVNCDGGMSGGDKTAGAGGLIELFAIDGNMEMAGKLLVRGGGARDSGGRGGGGGRVNLFTDNNFNGIGGNLTVMTTGLIDASGGAGTIGGSARSDGAPGTPVFPPGLEQIAILVNSDGRRGAPRNGELRNLGTIIARGGIGNGSGGDVVYHGRAPGRGNNPPLRGHVEVEADGTGLTGDFFSD